MREIAGKKMYLIDPLLCMSFYRYFSSAAYRFFPSFTAHGNLSHSVLNTAA